MISLTNNFPYFLFFVLYRSKLNENFFIDTLTNNALFHTITFYSNEKN